MCGNVHMLEIRSPHKHKNGWDDKESKGSSLLLLLLLLCALRALTRVCVRMRANARLCVCVCVGVPVPARVSVFGSEEELSFSRIYKKKMRVLLVQLAGYMTLGA